MSEGVAVSTVKSTYSDGVEQRPCRSRRGVPCPGRAGRPPDYRLEKLEPPDAAESRLSRAASLVSRAGGRLTGLQRLMLEAITDSMTGFVVPASALPRSVPRRSPRR